MKSYISIYEELMSINESVKRIIYEAEKMESGSLTTQNGIDRLDKILAHSDNIFNSVKRVMEAAYIISLAIIENHQDTISPHEIEDKLNEIFLEDDPKGNVRKNPKK